MAKENKLIKVSTETTYNIVFEGIGYTVIHSEDADFSSSSYEIYEEPIMEDDEFDEDVMYVHNPIISEEMKNKIIEFVINNS